MEIISFLRTALAKDRKLYRYTGFLTIFLILLVALIPSVTLAGPSQWFSDFLVNSGFSLMNWGAWLLSKGSELTNAVVGHPAIAETWESVRNLALSLFSIAILTIAIMNLLKINIATWGASRLIPKLFLAAFAVFFSKYFCLSIINLSNAASISIINFTDVNILDNKQGLPRLFFEMWKSLGSSPKPGEATIFFVFGVAWFLATAVLAAILIFRASILAFLIALSPIIFAFLALPWTAGFTTTWLKTFIKWAFFLPMCLLVLGISMKILDQSTMLGADTVINPWRANLIGGGEVIGDYEMSHLYAQFDIDQQAQGSFVQFFNIVFALVTVPLSIYLPLNILGAAGTFIQQLITGKKGPNTPFSPKRIRNYWSRRDKARTGSKRNRLGVFGEGRIGNWVTGKGFAEVNEATKERKKLGVPQQKTKTKYAIDTLRGRRSKSGRGQVAKASGTTGTKKARSGWNTLKNLGGK